MDALITRRTLLLASGALLVSFAMRPRLGHTAPAGVSKSLAIDVADSFLAVGNDGTVTVYSGKVDLGTGVRTALTQIVADELNLPFSRVSVIQGDTELTPDQGPTYGSLSIQNGGMQLRHAAATARQAMLRRAATKIGVDTSALLMRDGMVFGPGGQKLPISALVGQVGTPLEMDMNAPLKAPAEFKLVGKSVARLDIPGKVFGTFTFMQDFRLPGMLHGRIVRPAGVGATLATIDEESVARIPGVVKVVRLRDFVGVVAQTEWGAIKAARALPVTWSNWVGLPDQNRLWDHVRATRIVKDDVTSNIGDSTSALASAARRFAATYDFAIHTHGSIGPSCAVAQFDGAKLTCWSASQATHNLRKQLARMLEMNDSDVRCIYVDGGGCYGRNGHEDAAADAALLARAVGAPVRVQWMREEEHGWDPKGPPTLLDMRAGINSSNEINAWQSELYIPDGMAGNVALVAGDHAGLDTLGKLSPGGVINDLAIPYAIENIKTTAHRLESTPFKPSWIRSPGRMQNCFANESFFDELAVHIGADPLEARLRYLRDARGKELLQRLATLSGWRQRSRSKHPSGKATGYGLAYVKYELVRTYVGIVCEVEADRETGEIRAKRFFVTHDCGQVINPDGLRNQIEGNVVQTVSRTLKEEIRFNRSRVTSLDWASYPILRFTEIPQVVIDLIDRPQETPWGAGEPTAALVPAAIGNAVFDAIGIRLRSVPFTPSKVRQALAQSHSNSQKS